MLDNYFSFFSFTPIPFHRKNHSHHDKNDYANANTLREPALLINHNSDIYSIE